jgi:predicted small lipoprotein YifL
MLRLGCLLFSVVVLSGCGYKTDLTLPEPDAALDSSVILVSAPPQRSAEYWI